MEDIKNNMGGIVENLPETIDQSDIAVMDNSPMATYSLLLSQKADLSQFEKMLEIQEKWEKREAEKAYTKAMASFKADPPVINKDKQVSYGNTKYSHASLGNVTSTINSALGKHGLTASWPLEQTDKLIKVTCTITHELGHSESTSLSAAHDPTGSKNAIQAMGSTISYLQRYTILSLTGLATNDQDDDGRTEEIKYIDEKQVSEITDMLNDKYTNPADVKGFLDWEKIESIETIHAKDYGMIKSKIKAAT